MNNHTLENEMNLKSSKELLGGPSVLEQIEEMEINLLIDFTNHPFKVLEDESMLKLMDSVKENGIVTPIIVRPSKFGKYQIIAGHRRTKACKLLGLDTIPAIVRDLDDEDAVFHMVDTNIQREMILHSEKAFAYKMKFDAIKKKSGRPSNNKGPVVPDSEKGKPSSDIIGDEFGESGRQVKRYIRLTELSTQLLDEVDSKKIPFRVGVELSYLTKDEQEFTSSVMNEVNVVPSIEQAVLLKEQSRDGTLTSSTARKILEESGIIPKKISFKLDTTKYFAANTSKEEIVSIIEELLNKWAEEQKN